MNEYKPRNRTYSVEPRCKFKLTTNRGQLRIEKEVWNGKRKVNYKAKEKARRLRKSQ